MKLVNLTQADSGSMMSLFSSTPSTPSAVTAFEQSAAGAQAEVQKDMDAKLGEVQASATPDVASQGQGFSSMASGALQEIKPPSIDGDDATGGDAYTPVSPSQPTQPTQTAAPDLTNGSTPLSSVDPSSVPVPSADTKRPAGDTRTAQQIIDQNPLLANLGNQGSVPVLDSNGKPVIGKDGKPETMGARDALMKQCGDFEHDPDAAYRAVQVLNYIKSSTQSDGKTQVSAGVVDNGKVDGFTSSGDARHGTAAGMLQDFGKGGYAYLGSTKHALPTTTDSHVRSDGTNMSNVEWVGHEILHGLSEAFQWMAKIAEKVLGKIPGIGKLLADAAGVITTAISGALNVADTAVEHGDVKKAAKDMGADVVGSLVDAVDVTGLAGSAADNAIRQKIGG